MTRIIIEFEVSRDQIQSVYNFSVHKGLILTHNLFSPTMLCNQIIFHTIALSAGQASSIS